MTYDPMTYWQTRLKEGTDDPCGAGRKDKCKMANWETFAKAAVKVYKLLDSYNGIGDTLEVGLGNGFFIPFIASLATTYRGCDITDVNFGRLADKYGNEEVFLKVDICGQLPTNWVTDKFDCIVMLDVEQHIVDPVKWKGMIDNIKSILRPRGRFICTTWNVPFTKAKSEYEVERSMDDYHLQFHEPDYFCEIVNFYRDKRLFVVEAL